MPGENLELISLNVWHIVASIANLLILTLIVRKFLFRPVQKMLAERKAQVDALYSDAEKAQTDANAAKTEYETKLEGARREAADIVQSAVVRADRMSEKIISEANDRAAEKMRTAEAEIAQEKKKALNEVKNEISDMSVDIAKQVVGREIRKEDHQRLIDSFIDTL